MSIGKPQGPTLHGWRRYWCKRDEAYDLSDAGFLTDPETEVGRYLQRHAVALDRLEEVPCLALLGEPGIGKSTVTRQEHERLLASGHCSLLVDMACVSTGEALRASLGSDFSDAPSPVFIFLDGFDEGLARNPSLAAETMIVIGTLTIANIRLRVTSRTLEWPASMELNLQRNWGNDVVQVYELLPLRRADVAAAASDRGVKANEFIDCVQERDSTSLAIRPISLRFLLEMYVRDGTLPHSKRRLYDEGTLILCSEEGTFQRGGSRANADVFRRRAIAARIAALTSFTNLQVIDRNEPASSEALTLSALAGGTESIANTTYDIDAVAVEDVLTGTALFSALSPSTFGWSHQSYREFLAAWYLAQRDLKLETIVSMYLPGREMSRVPGPLREVAAWHATLAPGVFELLVQRDPEVLLHSDTAAVSPESRAQLAESLLRRFEAFEAIDGNHWRREYKRLEHPDLADQLRPRIRNIAANIMVRRAAMEIAWACGVRAVVEDLLAVLRNFTDDLIARQSAARALARIGGDEVHHAFRNLLANGIGPDPDDSIRGSIVSGLWPDHIDAALLFQHLPHPQLEGFLGAYQTFLDKLSKTLRPADIPDALEWLTRLGEGSGYSIGKVEAGIIDAALRNLDVPGVLSHLCRIIRSSFKTYSERPWRAWRLSRTEERPQLTTEHRRAIVAELIATAHSDQHLSSRMIRSQPPLLLGEDIAWLAEQAVSAPDPEIAGALGQCVAGLYSRYGYPTDNTTADAVLLVESPTFREPLRPFLEPIVLGSDEARPRQGAWDEAQRGFPDDVEKPEPPLWSVASPHLARFEAGDLPRWLDFVDAWTRQLTKAVEADTDWNALQAEDQGRILAAAFRFVNEAAAPDPAWLDEGDSYPWPAIGGRVALQLMGIAGTALLHEVTRSAWARWAHVLVGVQLPNCTQEIAADLFRRAYRHAPDELCGAIVRIARRENCDGAHLQVIEKLPQPLGEQLQEALLQLLDELSEHAFDSALEALVASGNADALARGAAAVAEASAGRAARAACVVLARDGSSWPSTIARMQRDREFTEIFASLVSFDEDERLSPLCTLNEDLTGQLYLTLLRLFPPAHARRRRGGLLRATEHTAWFRKRIIQRLVEYGTDAGIQALEWLITQEPSNEDLRWHLVTARQKHADTGWQPLTIEAFWKMISLSIAKKAGAPDGALECVVVLRDGVKPSEVARELKAQVPTINPVMSGPTLTVVAPPDALTHLQEAAEKTTLLNEVILGIQAGDEWIFEAVPYVPLRVPAIRDVPSVAIEGLLLRVHVLIETATDTETAALLALMQPLPGEAALVVGSIGVATYTIGALGQYAVAHFQSDMGPDGPNAADIATIDAIREVNPKVILLVGIAFGMNRSKQRLGDVLVAQYSTGYEMTKLKPDSIEERGPTLPASTVLCERFKSHKRSWRFPRTDGSQVAVLIGQVLSGGKFVNSREFRDCLAQRFPSALGGEMEGIGAYAAAHRKGVPVLLAKAICDWADEMKNDRAQPFAAAAAASVVRHVLDKPDALLALAVPSLTDDDHEEASSP